MWGVYVFIRASHNWHELTQKYQDEIVRQQAKNKADKTPAVVWNERGLRVPLGGWLIRECGRFILLIALLTLAYY